MLNIKMAFFLHWCQFASSITPYTNLHLQRPKTTISYPSPKPKIKVHLKICYAYRLREKSVFCWNTFYLNLLKKPWIATLLINCTHCNSIQKKTVHTAKKRWIPSIWQRTKWQNKTSSSFQFSVWHLLCFTSFLQRHTQRKTMYLYGPKCN